MEIDEREAFIEEHFLEMLEVLEGMGIEDPNISDGCILADTLYCLGWRKVTEGGGNAAISSPAGSP